MIALAIGVPPTARHPSLSRVASATSESSRIRDIRVVSHPRQGDNTDANTAEAQHAFWIYWTWQEAAMRQQELASNC